MISLPSVKTFCTIVVLLFLSEFSHIYTFNTAIRHAAKPQTHSLPSVSDPAFSFRSIWLDKGCPNTHLEESSTGQILFSMNISRVLEQDTVISTCDQTETVVELNPYGRISHNISLVTAQVTKYCLHSPNIYHDKTMFYAQDMLFTYEYYFCLVKSGEQNHTIEYSTGHLIVTILFDFIHLSCKFVLTVTLHLLMSLLNWFRLILFYEWPPYIQNLGLFTMYGCLIEHVSVHE